MARASLVFLYALVLSLAGTLAAQDAEPAPAPAPAASDAASESPKVSVDLICDAKTIVPGQNFTLGLHVKLSPQWHTYWLNPGAAGLAPKVEITTDSGITFDPLQFPIPKKFGEGDTLAYGYENEVLFLIPAHAPADLKPNQLATLHARVELLVCKNQCYMQTGAIKSAVYVGAKSQPANAELFATWRSRLPAEKPDWESAVVKAPQAAGEQATIALEWRDAPPAAVEFFPGSPQAVEVSNVTFENDLKRSVIRFVPELLERGMLDQGRMLTLVVYVDSQGQRRGSYVWVPVLPVNP